MKITVNGNQVIAQCVHCRSQVWTHPTNWVDGLKKEATRLGWRIKVEEKDLSVLCECKFHRTDIVRKWSFIVNDHRKHQGGDNLSSSGWYGRFQIVEGVFALERVPYLLSKLFPWNYFGSAGGFEARNLFFSKDEFLKNIDKLPEGQSIKITDK